MPDYIDKINVNGTEYNIVDNTSVADVSDVKVGTTGNTSSIVTNGVAELITNSAYNSSTNKIATMSDLPTNTDTVIGWYGTCSTTASTSEKAVTCSGYVLNKGNIIGVLFTTANTAATPTLNVNSTGAKTILIGNSTLSDTNPLKWSANTILYFMYDGTYYKYISSVSASSVTPSRGANTWYGYSDTAGQTQSKTATSANYVLTKGSLISVRFTYPNTYTSAKITLNVNSTGAKDIYYNGAVTSSTNTLLWDAGEILTFIYDSAEYWFVSRSKDVGGGGVYFQEVGLMGGVVNWSELTAAYNDGKAIIGTATYSANNVAYYKLDEISISTTTGTSNDDYLRFSLIDGSNDDGGTGSASLTKAQFVWGAGDWENDGYAYTTTVTGLPEVTSSDNGKILRVVNGAWAAVQLPSASGVSF